MALIKCDECGREISDRSAFCPGCGYPTHLNKSVTSSENSENSEKSEKSEKSVNSENPNLRNKITLFIAVFAVLLFLVLGLYLYEDHRSSHAETTEEAAADTLDAATVLPLEVDTLAQPVDTVVPVAKPAVKKAVEPETPAPAVADEPVTAPPVETPAPAPVETPAAEPAAAPAAE